MNTMQRKLKEQRYLKRREQKLKDVGTLSAINILQVIPLYMLATEYGFGNIRLDRFLNRLYNLVEQTANDKTILYKMCDVLKHDKGILIDFNPNSNRAENIWQDENDTRKVIRGAKKCSNTSKKTTKK